MLTINLTNEEIVNVLNSLIRQFTRLEQPTTTTALKVAVGSVLKQTPAKPKEVGDRLYCPRCMNPDIRWIEGEIDNYCWRCGQKLKYDNED